MIPERAVLLPVQHLQHGGGGIAAELMKEQDAAAVCRMLEDFFEEGLRV